MNSPTPSIRAWAERLLAAERTSQPAYQANSDAVGRVCEKLRVTLTQFVGADGFTALLRRSLAMARTDFPSLHTAKVTAKGQLEGLETCPADAGTDIEAAIAITAHLLGLLVTFMGESLTVRLVSDAWADAHSQSFVEEPEDL